MSDNVVMRMGIARFCLGLSLSATVFANNAKAEDAEKKTLDSADVKKVVEQNMPAVRECIKSFLSDHADEDFPNKMTLKFVIQKSGTTTQPQVLPAAFKESDLEKCTVESMKTWKFPRFQSPNTLPVSFPITLRSDK